MRYKCSCAPGSAFHWRDPNYKTHINWRELNKAQISSERSSQLVNDQRALGIDVATISGLSKIPRKVQVDPKRFHIYTKAKPSVKN